MTKQIANSSFKDAVSKNLLNRHVGYQTSYYLNFKEESNSSFFLYSIGEGKSNYQSQETLVSNMLANYIYSLEKLKQPVVFYQIEQDQGSTYISGLGSQHVTETGLDTHTTFGVPYLKGSALKGVLSHWVKQVESELSEEVYLQIFGSDDDQNPKQGDIVFHDVFFDKFNLQSDIMSPHFGAYYGGEQLSEQNSPIPIDFITVAFSQAGIGALSLTPHAKLTEADLDIIVTWLNQALQEFGIGAKTALGYGRFRVNLLSDQLKQVYLSKKEKQIQAIENKEKELLEQQKQVEQAEKLREIAADEDEFQALLALQKGETDNHFANQELKQEKWIDLSANYPYYNQQLIEFYDRKGWLRPKKSQKTLIKRVQKLKDIYQNLHGEPYQEKYGKN